MDLEKNNSLIYFYHTRKQNSSKCGPHSKDEIENLIKNNVIKKESWICINNSAWREAQKTDFAEFFNENNSNFQPKEVIDVFFILIPLLSALISVIILHSISPLAVLMSHYTLLSATIFFMAVLTSVDSDKIKEISSTGYFFGVLFLYPIIYPIYLYKRNEYGKKNLSVLGVFAIIILIVATMYVVGSIGKMQNEAIKQIQSETIQQLRDSIKYRY